MSTIHIPGNGHTRMIAHRGLSGREKENTCAAFVAAGNRSYFGIETDIHTTADGKYILIHDSETGRVAEENLPVEGSTLEKLCALVLPDNAGVPRGDLHLPLPEEYLRICRAYDKIAVLELKAPFSAAQLLEIRELVRTHYDEAHTVYISFFYENLTALREMDGSLKLQFLCGGPDDLNEERMQDMAARKIDADAYFGLLSEEKIARLHELGLEVNAWTVDSPELAAELMRRGVDYLTTDILETEE